jgi:hypothetical protein
LGNDLDYSGQVHEIVDGSVPIYNKEIEDTWYLHGNQLEEAYENAGVGDNPRENSGMTAIYFYIHEQVAEWYHKNANYITEEWSARDEDIIEGMARALFVTAWADYEEEEGRTYPGEDLMDVAPATPQEAVDAAEELYDTIESKSKINLNTFTPPGFDEGEWSGLLAVELGHYLAMESLGHGVSWSDDYNDHGLKTPSVQSYWDGKKLDFSI